MSPTWLVLVVAAFVAAAAVAQPQTPSLNTTTALYNSGGGKVLCHYNSSSFHRRGKWKRDSRTSNIPCHHPNFVSLPLPCV